VAAADARKIMEAVYHQDTSRDATWRAVMEVTDKKGTVRRKKFTFRKLGSLGDSKTLVRFTDPPDVRGVGLLSINIKGTADRQWMYTPAIQRTRRIAPQEKSRRFLGTDFTHEDMAERVLDDFEYRMLGETGMIDGRKTYKIEATPVAPDRSQYKFIYLWVAQDIPYVIHAEMYDQRGQKVRVFHASALEKISGIWVAKRIEMSSSLESTKTLLMIEEIRFNTGLKEDLFTQYALEKGDVF
jgi:outer membrane lipoprotein-sorting protein